MRWVVSTTPRPLYSWGSTGTHCTGSYLGPGTGLDECGTSRPLTGIRYPGRPLRSESLYRPSYLLSPLIQGSNVLPDWAYGVRAVDVMVFWYLAPVVWPIDTYILKESTYLVSSHSALRLKVPDVCETVVEESWALWKTVLFQLRDLSS
jgi:hypothetical protein